MPLGFAAQFECHPERVPIEDGLVLQIYYPDDELYIPLNDICPVVIKKDTLLSSDPNKWTKLEDPPVVPHTIEWEPSNDPEAIEFDWTDVFGTSDLRQSKAMGTCGFPDALAPGETCILQIEEFPGGFVFGGEVCLIIKRPDGTIRVTTA